jgi:tRNA(Ile)-lysidine synthase
VIPAPQALAGFIAEHFPGCCIRVAFSGGLDSTVLLHLLARSCARPLIAVHVHHGLQAPADDWAVHCQAQAATLGVAIEVLCVTVDRAAPSGPEAAARTARRSALRGTMRDGDVLATAHHRDDQAETVLLRLLRGTGVDGLAAMRALTPFPPGRLWRPLLQVSRAELRDYALQEDLRWIDDPHNQDPRYARSWLRRVAMPLLRERWPGVDAALARAAEHAAEASDLLQELAQSDLVPLRAGEGLRIAALQVLPQARRRNALRSWLRERGVDDLPSADALARIEHEVLAAAADAWPRWPMRHIELRRYRGVLYALPCLQAEPGGVILEWSVGEQFDLPAGCGRLLATAPPPLPLRVAFPQGGERLCPATNSRTRSLKNLFQEAGVPPWLRQRTPLLYVAGRLVAAGDRWQTPQWRALCAQRGWSYRWQLPAGLDQSRSGSATPR